MSGLHVDDCRHLRAALEYKSRNGHGSCIQRSMGLALDLKKAIVTFGTLRGATDEELEHRPDWSRTAFIHCWVEVGDAVLAPTTIERTGGVIVPMTRVSYYEVNAARDVCHVPREAFDAIARRHRLSAALRHGSERFGSSAVADELLAAAGVRYVLGEHRALLPASIGATA